MHGYVSSTLNSMREEFIRAWAYVTILMFQTYQFGGTDSVCVCTESDPRKKKWDPGFHEHIDPPPLPSSLPLSLLLTHLWQCNSRISCSLSKWADWIDVFPLHDPFHTEGTNSTEKSFHFLVAHFALNVFTDWAFTFCSDVQLRSISQSVLGWGQAPFVHTLLFVSERTAQFGKYWWAFTMETDQMWCQISDLRHWSALIGSDELFSPSCSLITLSIKAKVCSESQQGEQLSERCVWAAGDMDKSYRTMYEILYYVDVYCEPIFIHLPNIKSLLEG